MGVKWQVCVTKRFRQFTKALHPKGFHSNREFPKKPTNVSRFTMIGHRTRDHSVYFLYPLRIRPAARTRLQFRLHLFICIPLRRIPIPKRILSDILATGHVKLPKRRTGSPFSGENAKNAILRETRGHGVDVNVTIIVYNARSAQLDHRRIPIIGIYEMRCTSVSTR